jgi:F-type H+-transporting ATPase subunit b
VNRFNLIIANAAALLWASTSFAAEGGHHAEPHIANMWGLGEKYAESPALGWLTITFAVFAWGVVRSARGPLKNHLETRADGLEKAMVEAQKAKADAERRAKEAEQKLAALEGDMKQMQADFESQGKLEAERIKTSAEEMAKKIAKDAEDTIGAEMERAREQLRAEASRLALQLAEERIKHMLTAADDEKLKKTLIQDLAA